MNSNSLSIGDNVLAIFLGYGEGAKNEATAIQKLEPFIQKELEKRTDAIKPAFRLNSAKIYTGEKDVVALEGGQQTVERRLIERANMAIFVFRNRVGKTCWGELEQCKNRGIPIIVLFPERMPPEVKHKDEHQLKDWKDMVEKEKELRRDWDTPDSKALKPIKNYEVVEHPENNLQLIEERLKSLIDNDLQLALTHIVNKGLLVEQQQGVIKKLEHLLEFSRELFGYQFQQEADFDLFDRLLNNSLEKLMDKIDNWLKGYKSGKITLNDSQDAIEKGITVSECLKKGGYATLLVVLNEWEIDGKYAKSYRESSKEKKLSIERVFIIPDENAKELHESILNPSFHDHVKLDHEAGIITFIAFKSQISDKDAVQDFGIWDNELVCVVGTSNKGGQQKIVSCSFSKDKRELSKAESWKSIIERASLPAMEFLDPIMKLDQEIIDLMHSAYSMKELAKEKCKGSYLSQQNCEWYHSSWQYLRILGMVSSPKWHQEFYDNSFKNAFNNDLNKILVCGTADYGILQIIEGAIPSGTTVNISILDLCKTPLRICENYIEKKSEKKFDKCSILHENVLEYPFAKDAFDIITTDAFLTRFNKEGRRTIVDKWYSTLRKGGVVITTVRISEKNGSRIKGTQEQVDAFVKKAEKIIKDQKPWFLPIKETIKQLAHDYAENIISYPLCSEDDIKELFSSFDCDIKIEEIENGEFIKKTKYAHVIAVKKRLIIKKTLDGLFRTFPRKRATKKPSAGRGVSETQCGGRRTKLRNPEYGQINGLLFTDQLH